MGQDQNKIEWQGDVPVSTRFDDPYYSLENGLEETKYVFLDGNGLPERFRDGFHIAELGFGTGLNFLAALQAFRSARIPGMLHFTSFEAFPLSLRDMSLALGAYDCLPTDILTGGNGPTLATKIQTSDFRLRIILGDARRTLPDWAGLADAWFLDGFAPARNPEMWGATLMSDVAKHTAAQGTFATYTAVGDVRRALSAAGFEVERIPGFGRKRHMTRGRLP